MEIEYKGGNCVVIYTKKSVLLIDPKIEALDNREISIKNSIQIATQEKFGSSKAEGLQFESPGEYEVANASIKGIAARTHLNDSEVKNATMYNIDMEDIRLGVIGHVAADISDEQLEELGTVDVLIIPVGGYGYTLEPHEAISLVKRIGPKVVIPTHYSDEETIYSIAQGGLDSFLKELGAPTETVNKYKIKSTTLPEVLTVVKVIQS
ncbi:MAG TPA: MBL fold metallo-hydrolase [Verrucomicrobiae bacterium]|nr:MBL fold metallo-hydrolase [Verrucomicrobiae bacterium]